METSNEDVLQLKLTFMIIMELSKCKLILRKGITTTVIQTVTTINQLTKGTTIWKWNMNILH